MTVYQTEAARVMDTNDLIIRAQNLTKQFGDEIAVNDVSFQMPRGAIFGFIGPSGSGKTTTVRLMTGIYKPSSGEVDVLGRNPVNFSRTDREKIGYLPQQFVLYRDLTIQENMNFAASVYGVGFLKRGRRIRDLLEFVELDEHRNKVVSKISGGMQRRLSLASTLIHGPQLLFLDEPTAGIDPVLRRKFWDYFKELQSNGVTMFVTTQYVGEAAYCDWVGVMADGRILLVDTPEGLRRSAFGGDAVDLQTTERVDYQLVQSLRQLPFLTGDLVRLNDNGLRLVVEDSSTAIPALVEWCGEQGVSIESIDKYLPPFDDVFVKLIQRFNPNDQ